MRIGAACYLTSPAPRTAWRRWAGNGDGGRGSNSLLPCGLGGSARHTTGKGWWKRRHCRRERAKTLQSQFDLSLIGFRSIRFSARPRSSQGIDALATIREAPTGAPVMFVRSTPAYGLPPGVGWAIACQAARCGPLSAPGVNASISETRRRRERATLALLARTGGHRISRWAKTRAERRRPRIERGNLSDGTDVQDGGRALLVGSLRLKYGGRCGEFKRLLPMSRARAK